MKIGLFLCNCGTEISRTIDTEGLKGYFETQENLSLIFLHPHLCDEAGQERLKVLLKENEIGGWSLAPVPPSST